MLEIIHQKQNMRQLPQKLRGSVVLLQAKRIKEEDAVSIIVSGFCKDVFKELPMEFAVEAQKLMEVTLEGA